MPEDFLKRCSKLVADYLCPVLGAGVISAGGAGLYAYGEVSQKIDAANIQVGEIQQSIAGMEGDLKVIRFRLDQATPARIVSAP